MTTGFDAIEVRAQSPFQPIAPEVANVEPLFLFGHAAIRLQGEVLGFERCKVPARFAPIPRARISISSADPVTLRDPHTPASILSSVGSQRELGP